MLIFCENFELIGVETALFDKWDFFLRRSLQDVDSLGFEVISFSFGADSGVSVAIVLRRVPYLTNLLTYWVLRHQFLRV